MRKARSWSWKKKKWHKHYASTHSAMVNVVMGDLCSYWPPLLNKVHNVPVCIVYNVQIYHNSLITMLYHCKIAGSSPRFFSWPFAPNFSRFDWEGSRPQFSLFEDLKSSNTLLSKTDREISDRASDLVKAYERLSPRTIHLHGSFSPVVLLFSDVVRDPLSSFSFFPLSLSRWIISRKSEVEQLTWIFVVCVTAYSKRTDGYRLRESFICGAVRLVGERRRKTKSFDSKAHADG